MYSGQTKIAYVLPEYNERTDTHLYYNYELIKDASYKLDIFVVAEKADGVFNLGTPYRAQKHQKGFRRFFEIFWILFSLRGKGYNNFYVHYSYYGALAAWLTSKIRGGRVFYWNCGMPWLFKRPSFEESVFRFILKHTTVVTGTESLAKEYQKRYRVRDYRILSNWVDADRLRPRESKEATKSWFGLKAENKIVLFVHHLSERKGADLIPKIAEAFPGVYFLVAGEGPSKKSLIDEASKSNAIIRILGGVANSDIAPYLQAADVFIMPSREEGLPHVILDTMAAGTPFVAADVGGTKDLVPRGYENFLCESGNVDCFQNKIKKLLEDKEIYNSFREACFKKALEFGREKATRDFIALF